MIIDSLRNYIKKNKLYIMIVFFLTIAIYGAWAAQNIVTFDAEGLYAEQNNIFWYRQWFNLGRWALVVLKKILGVSIINPFFSVTFFFLLFPVSSMLWNFALCFWTGRDTGIGLGKIVFDLLYLSSPIWAHQFAYRNQMECIALLMVLLPLFTLMLSKWLTSGGIQWMVLSFIGIVFCFAGYQSFLILYVEAVMVYFLMQVMYLKIPRKTFYFRLFKVLVFSAAAYAVYSISCNVVCNILSISREEYQDYLLGQILWGKQPFQECLQSTLSAIEKMVLGDGVTYTAVFVIEFAVAVIMLIGYWIKKGNLRIWTTLIVLLLFIEPFSLTVLTTGSAVHRQDFSFAFAIALAGTIELNVIYRIFREGRGKATITVVCIMAAIAAFVPQLQLQTRLLYSQCKAAVKDYGMMEAIYYEALEKGAQEWDAIVIVGTYTFGEDESITREEATGVSYFEVNAQYCDKVIDAFQAYGFEVVEPTAEQKEFAEEKAADMPCWPDADSIYVENHVIIVKLS